MDNKAVEPSNPAFVKLTIAGTDRPVYLRKSAVEFITQVTQPTLKRPDTLVCMPSAPGDDGVYVNETPAEVLNMLREAPAPIVNDTEWEG